jgi:hypothetical protein
MNRRTPHINQIGAFYSATLMVSPLDKNTKSMAFQNTVSTSLRAQGRVLECFSAMICDTCWILAVQGGLRVYNYN